MSPQYGKLPPTNGWGRFGSLGHPRKFQRVSRLDFVTGITAPTSRNGSQPNFARCLAVSWAGTLCIHFWGLLSPQGILPGAKFTLRPNLAFSYIGIVITRHSSSGRQPNFAALSRQRHQYSAGRPWRWALAHILVITALWNRAGHYIFALWFLLLPCFFFFSSPNLSRGRLNVYHTSTHGVALVRI